MSEIVVEPKNKALQSGVPSSGEGMSIPRTDPNALDERQTNGQPESHDTDMSNELSELQLDDERFPEQEYTNKGVCRDEIKIGGEITVGDFPSLPDREQQDVNDRGADDVVTAGDKASRLLNEALKNDVFHLDDPGNLRVIKQEIAIQNDSTDAEKEPVVGTSTLINTEDISSNGEVCNRSDGQSSEERKTGEMPAEQKNASVDSSQITDEASEVVASGEATDEKPASLEGATASEPKRPDSIPLVNSIDLYRRLHDPLSEIRTEGRKEEEKGAVGGGELGLSQQGFVSREGDMVSFVATDLTQKIKKSTPNRQTNDPELELILGQKEHMAAASDAVGGRKATDMPPIDPRVVVHLERQAKQVSESLEIMMGNLRGTLHSMSAITVGCMQTHRDMVESLGDTTDLCVKAMYTLIARCEELNNSMKPVHEIAQQIKDIKKQLEAFEALCK